MRTDDPWYDVQASGTGTDGTPPLPPAPVPAQRAAHDARAAVYLTVQDSAAFRQVRRRYRRFAMSAGTALLVWYFGYLLVSTAAPELMAEPVAGPLNVATVALLAQFAGVFLLTWAYTRHARLRRDELAFELRWETAEMTRALPASRHRALPTVDGVR